MALHEVGDTSLKASGSRTSRRFFDDVNKFYVNSTTHPNENAEAE